MRIPNILAFKPLHKEPQPRFFRYLLIAAWLDWVYAVFTTVMFAPSNRIAMGMPTLGTQVLLTCGMMLGSNVARGSYIVWTVFWDILILSAEGAPKDALALVQTYAGHIVEALVVVGLVLPRTNRWFAAIRTSHRQAAPEAQIQRIYRNFRVAACWALVWPISVCAGVFLGTPVEGVLAACVPGGCVALAITVRQCWKLYKLRRACRKKQVAMS